VPKKTKPKPDDEAQSKRFVEDAKRLEVDERGKSFDRALGVIVRPAKPIPKKRKDNS
jgi:hypothetical protein